MRKTLLILIIAVLIIAAGFSYYFLMRAPKLSDATFTFTAPDDIKIFVRRWAPENRAPKAAVQIIHGASEHSLRYESFARFLNNAGYVVYASDLRGHGETAKLAGLKLGVAGNDAWNNMLKDEKQLTDLIKKECRNCPVFLIGHSMGSLMAQDYMERWGSDLKGVVLSGTTGVFPNLDATLALAEQVAQAAADQPSPIYTQMFASFNTAFSPGQTGFEWLSRDGSEVQKYVNDKLCGFAFSNALTRDFLKGLSLMWQPEKEVLIPKNLPIYVTSGSMDPAGGNTLGVLALIMRYRTQQGIKFLDYKFYPGARHEILHETNRQEVEQDILNWLNGRLKEL